MDSMRINFRLIRKNILYLSDYGGNKLTIDTNPEIIRLKRAVRRQMHYGEKPNWTWRRSLEDGYSERYDFPVDEQHTHDDNEQEYDLWYHQKHILEDPGVQCYTTFLAVFRLKHKTVIYQWLQWRDSGV